VGLFLKTVTIAAAALVALMPGAAEGAGKQKQSEGSMKGKIFQASKPVDIKSDTLQVWHRERYGLFTGHVVADRGDVTLHCETLRADYDDAGEVEKLTCRGNVRVLMGRKEARGDLAVFDNAREKVTITGDPSLRDGDDVMRGEIIIFNLDDDTVNIEKPRGVYRMKPREEKERKDGGR
jgi:lipopolysaccharide transport protein LptA